MSTWNGFSDRAEAGRLAEQRALVAQAQARAKEFYVIDSTALGPFTYEEALKVQRQENERYGLDVDGEGYCNAIVLHVSHARTIGLVN